MIQKARAAAVAAAREKSRCLNLLHLEVLRQPVRPHLLHVEIDVIDSAEVIGAGAQLGELCGVLLVLHVIADGPVAFLLEGLHAFALAVSAAGDVADEQTGTGRAVGALGDKQALQIQQGGVGFQIQAPGNVIAGFVAVADLTGRGQAQGGIFPDRSPW